MLWSTQNAEMACRILAEEAPRLNRPRRQAIGARLVALVAFHVGQLAFGGVMWIWAPVMLVTLWLLLRAERQSYTTRASGHLAQHVSV